MSFDSNLTPLNVQEAAAPREELSSSALLDDIRNSQRSWSHVFNLDSTINEKLAVAAESMAALGAVATMAFGHSALSARLAESSLAGEAQAAGKDPVNRVARTVNELETAAAHEGGIARTFDGMAAIPDVLRTRLPENSIFSAQQMTHIGTRYREDVSSLLNLPRTFTAEAGDNAASIAEKLLSARAPITAERVAAGNVAKEVDRVEKLNQSLMGLSDWGGKEVTAYTSDGLRTIASDAVVYKHVPPIGQLLKSSGVTEAQIEEAFAYQKTLPQDAPRRFLGQILEDKEIITKATADAAEATQKALKTYLADILKETHTP